MRSNGRAYYNEIDPFAAQWIRNLIAAGHVMPGDVDERSIHDVRPDDVRGYQRCHWFAGIAVWDYALRLAGWPEDRPVWTGSCPCQPFSNAGRRRGVEDDRHLWPVWFELIRQCRPPKILGEQVASSGGLRWFDEVCCDLEGEDYACGAIGLSSAFAGAPHERPRLWVVADADAAGWVGLKERHEQPAGGQSAPRGDDADRRRCSFWSSALPLEGADGAWRWLEPGIEPLAHGAPARVGRLRAYGNAINAEAAAEFIRAVRACAP